MRILITGGLGHIGSALVETLSMRQDKIVVLDNLHTQRYPVLFNLPQGITFIEDDITTANLDRYFDGVDVVVHLAALTDAANSRNLKKEMVRVNTDGAANVANACRRCGCKMIFPSTTSVYGVQEGVVDEGCGQLNPQSPYADSKLTTEKILMDTDLDFVIFRFGTIFGASDGMRFHTAVNKFIWQAVQGKPVEVWESAIDQKRPYLHLNDAMEVIKFAINRNLFNRQIYNVATLNTSPYTIIHSIEEVLGKAIDVKLVQHELMNQLSYIVDTKKIFLQGFIPSGILKDGILDTVMLLGAMRV